MHPSRISLAAAGATIALVGADPGHGRSRSPRAAAAAPAAHRTILKPLGPAADDIFPEGIAIGGRALLRGQHDRRHDLPRQGGRQEATPFLLGGQRRPHIRRRHEGEQGQAVHRRRRHRPGLRLRPRSRKLVGSWLVRADRRADLPQRHRGRRRRRDLRHRLAAAGALPDPARQADHRRREAAAGLHRTSPARLCSTRTGFNVNGIATSANGQLPGAGAVQHRRLFRVRIADRQVSRVDLHGQEVAGDGLVLSGTGRVRRRAAGRRRLHRQDPPGESAPGTVLSRYDRSRLQRPDDRRARPRPAAGGQQPVRRAPAGVAARTLHGLERSERPDPPQARRPYPRRP